jgi:hypothetical protein
MGFIGFWDPEKAIVRAMEFLAFKKKARKGCKRFLGFVSKTAFKPRVSLDR